MPDMRTKVVQDHSSVHGRAIHLNMFLPWENAEVKKGSDGRLVRGRKSTFECEPHCQCTLSSFQLAPFA